MQLEKRINATTVVRVNGESTVACFDAWIEALQIFGQDVCGVCKTAGAQLQIRRHGQHKFYEVACQNAKCKAKLGLVAMQDGRMFPSRQNKDKTWKDNGGWEIYQPTNGQAREHSQEPNREPQSYSQEEESIPF